MSLSLISVFLAALSTSPKLKMVASQSSGCVLLLKSSSSRWPYLKPLVHSRPWECCRYSLERRSLCWNALTLPPQVVCAIMIVHSVLVWPWYSCYNVVLLFYSSSSSSQATGGTKWLTSEQWSTAEWEHSNTSSSSPMNTCSTPMVWSEPVASNMAILSCLTSVVEHSQMTAMQPSSTLERWKALPETPKLMTSSFRLSRVSLPHLFLSFSLIGTFPTMTVLRVWQLLEIVVWTGSQLYLSWNAGVVVRTCLQAV